MGRFVLCALILSVSKQSIGQADKDQERASRCVMAGKYFVRLVDDGQSNGEFISFYKANNQNISEEACKANEYGEPYFKIEQVGNIFDGVHNDFAIIDSGTGTGPRGFELYDLIKKKSVIRLGANEYEFINDTLIGLWIQKDYNKLGCTKEQLDEYRLYGRPGFATLRKYILDTTTMRLTKTAETQCTSTP